MKGALCMPNKSNLLDMNIQYFADPNNDPNQTGNNTDPKPKDPNTGNNNDDPKTSDPNQGGDDTDQKSTDPDDGNQSDPKYSTDDVQKIVQEALAKAEEKRKADVEEAKRKAKMSAAQIKEYEAEKAKKQAEEATEKLKHYELRDSVRSQLTESGLTLTDSELELVVDKDEESTNAKVEIIKGLCQRITQQVKSELIKGPTPKVGSSKINNLTPEEFNKMSSQDRANLFKTNPEVFNKVVGGM